MFYSSADTIGTATVCSGHFLTAQCIIEVSSACVFACMHACMCVHVCVSLCTSVCVCVCMCGGTTVYY